MAATPKVVLPGLGSGAVDVTHLAVEMLDRSVDSAVFAVGVLLGIVMFPAFFMLIMFYSTAAQSVTDLTLVFHLTADSNNDEVPGTTATALTSLS